MFNLPILSDDHADFLAKTFARNRESFGGWSMELASDSTPVSSEPAVAAPTPEAAPAPDAPESPWSDPKAAEAEITKLRREAAASRTTAKQNAADEARSELAQTIGKALGIVKDDAPVDPADLTKQIAASQADAQQARVELAVFRAATSSGGDPAALLDSTSFLKSLDSIDPNDGAAIAAAISKAVEANPRLGAAPAAPKAPDPNPALGANGAAKSQPKSLSEAVGAYYA